MHGQVDPQGVVPPPVDDRWAGWRKLRAEVDSQEGRCPALQSLGCEIFLGERTEVVQPGMGRGDAREAAFSVEMEDDGAVGAQEPVDGSDPGDDVIGRPKARRSARVQGAGDGTEHAPSLSIPATARGENNGGRSAQCGGGVRQSGLGCSM
jgi:hypothetical protein